MVLLSTLRNLFLAVFLAHGKGLTHERCLILCKVHKKTQDVMKGQGGQRGVDLVVENGERANTKSVGVGNTRIWLAPDRTVLPNQVTV